MTHRLKLRIIFPVVSLNILFIAGLTTHCALRLSGSVPSQAMGSLLMTALAWIVAWLAGLTAVMVLLAGRLERTLEGHGAQVAAITQGHIRAAAPGTVAGEAGSLAHSLNEMSGFLDQTLIKIIAASGRLFSSTVNLQGAAEQCTASAGQQQCEAHAIATAAEEMSQTIAGIARNASLAADTSMSAREIVNRGKETAGRAVEAAARVGTATEELAGGVGALNRSVVEIGNIVSVINDIADQTNLLALNASIEAARSGEHGRGFAVVADEVRNLAARTIDATARIAEKISAVQRESHKTGAAMKDASQEVMNARARIGEVEESLHTITDSFEQVKDQVTRIATAVEQQSVTTAQVSASIETTSHMAGALSSVSTKVMDEVAAIGSITDNLLLLLGAFRLTAHYSAAEAVERIAAGEALRSMERSRQERELREAIRRNPFVELFYITDAAGRQVTANVAADSLAAGDPAYGAEACGKTWENRPWFRGVKESGNTFISELYRSAATGAFCCTIAVPLRDNGGRLLGVLGADINVVRISTLG
ncbi:methyl-accepting chemotaxis protein [Geobacter sp. FeAm09]|uniref:methyl-accepting chemotaxis protein n=1 Tax=Geobacter sp. FeAm09 TaxID=2597769 RepID=UPI00143CF893|nr:methyl-accepting chemotaxis protein [Geobacter sp. FeAm09]